MGLTWLILTTRTGITFLGVKPISYTLPSTQVLTLINIIYSKVRLIEKRIGIFVPPKKIRHSENEGNEDNNKTENRNTPDILQLSLDWQWPLRPRKRCHEDFLDTGTCPLPGRVKDFAIRGVLWKIWELNT